MKAFILAAGLGTRLRPLTSDIPKVMVEVGGKKILERTIGQLKSAGVEDLTINTHYFPESLTNYFGNGSKWGVKTQYSFEPEILGTAGGLKKVEDYFKNEKEFLVVYGDNVYDVDFAKIISHPLMPSAAAAIVLFNRKDNPNSGAAGGVVEVSDSGMVKGFYEGQARPEINYVNGGVYKFRPEIFKLIPPESFYDFGKDVFPKMLESRLALQAYIIGPKEALFGIDTLEYLEKANQYFTNK
jgi:mannose-1-phosphate guanylyltransferase